MPSRSYNYESNGPESRIRGNASQVYEKYLQLARDTQSGGDRVLAESFMQHAEHYYRILNESTDPNNRPQHQRDARHEEQVQGRDHERDHGGDHGGDEEDQVDGYGGDQQPLTPARSVSRFDDRRQEARSGDPRYAEAKSAGQDTDRAAPVQEPIAPAAEAEKGEAAATSAAVEGQDSKSEADAAKPVRRTRRSPTRRTTKSKSDEAPGGDEDAGLLKMLGGSPRPNGSSTRKAEPASESPVETAAETAAEPPATGSPELLAEEAEAKPAPKPRRRRTTKSSSEAANVDA